MRRLVLGVLTSSVLLVSGCSGSDSAGTEPTSSPTSASSSTSAPASPDPTSSSAATSTPPSSSGAEAATGPAVTSSIVTVHAPADWVNKATSTDLGGNVSGPTVEYNLSLSDLETQASDESVDALAELSQKASFYSPPLKRRDDGVVAGQPAYELAGNDSTFGGWAEEHGFRYQGHSVFITISTPRDLPQAARDTLAASILASVELR